MVSSQSKYDFIVSGTLGDSYQAIAQKLINKLPGFWINEYLGTISNRSTHILQVTDNGIFFLFDAVSLVYSSTKNCPYDDRLIAAFGISSQAKRVRDAGRMKGFLRGGLHDSSGRKLDKGHAASHAQGGGLDINLFPQNPDVNRGHKAHNGTDYRKMEKYCADHSNTFFFSKLTYRDNSWIPSHVEYGILKHEDKKIYVNEFIN